MPSSLQLGQGIPLLPKKKSLTNPFNRAYLGIDLYTEVDPYGVTFDTGMTVVVRF